MKQTLLLLFLAFSSSIAIAQTNQWTWMQGDKFSPGYPVYGTKGILTIENDPGARQSASTWTDASGDLWMFGGTGSPVAGSSDYFNDLWKYSVSTRQWTWISGDFFTNFPGVYGIKGMTASANKPGARKSAVTWTDTSGNLWLFGGIGYASFTSGYLNDLWKYNIATGRWTWISGDNTINKNGVFGNKGVPAVGNMPGARSDAVSWMDASGNLWLFSGNSTENLNDLWKYAPSTGLWTWMSGDYFNTQIGVYGTKGIAAATNKPGARISAAGWADASGNLWLFGGTGYSSSNSGNLNDLWKYNISTSQWTWVSGDNTTGNVGDYGTKGTPAATNTPGARSSAVSWADASGNLWLFGGNGFSPYGIGSLNDLWKYGPLTGQWTWMGGDISVNQNGIYGAKGLAAQVNMPGSRYNSLSWADNNGHLWLFGGYGYDADGYSNLNDLWNYNLSTGKWTWTSGNNNDGWLGIYGTKGIPDTTNKPGGLSGAVSWADASGNLWMFGGFGYTAYNAGAMNDLWKYAPATKQWTWISGDDTKYMPGIYGIKGTADFNNKPGARDGAVSWMDASGNLWLFGGYNHASVGKGILNDLWKYVPSSGQWTWMSGDNFADQTGVCNTMGTANTVNKPGARSSAVSWTDASGNLWLFGGRGFAMGTYGNLNDLWKYNPSSGLWTWMNGDSTTYQQGVYGTLSKAAFGNRPGARYGASGWKDASGNLWLFGGSDSKVTDDGTLSDLWRYDPSSGLWTWMNGDSTTYQQGVYGTRGTADDSNKPGAREYAVTATDASGNLWLLGGKGNAASNIGFVLNRGYLSDAWKYAPSTGRWTWMSGDSMANSYGNYGIQGISSTNMPGGRQSAISWTDASGKIWLFGGVGLSSNGFAYLNDLWQYSVPVLSLPVQFTSFTARLQVQSALLNWTTAQEQNSRYFAIERSNNGTVYDSIGKVVAMGTASSATNYSFIDKTPLQGTNFYRLKQLDYDRKLLYSAVAKVVIDVDATRFTVMQNPVKNTLQLNVQLPATRKLTLQIKDISGHLLLNEEKLGSQGSSVYSLPVERLASGTYFINIQTGNVSRTITFIKQ